MDAEAGAVGAGEDLSSLIRRALAEAGLNQTWLARETGIPLPTINAWVNRTRGTDGRIDPDRLRAIAGALPGVTVAEVFESAGRRAPGDLDAEREKKLLRLYRSLPTTQQRILIEQAELLARTARAS
ncbi:helix-turn-helix domain-containing protein [Kitasatospora sp. NPDC059646]|uniref:helix-turn-helix domain-containing protein n=1 Tax=Kitasatospora sp. NPDC059646 TaxID=3346893 RepID=UPI0036C60FA5